MFAPKDLTNRSKITIIELGNVSGSLRAFVPQHSRSVERMPGPADAGMHAERLQYGIKGTAGRYLHGPLRFFFGNAQACSVASQAGRAGNEANQSKY